jgi:hypothetical protein
VLATKAFYAMSDDPNDRGLSRKHLLASVDASLRRMGTDYIDLIVIHAFDPGTPIVHLGADDDPVAKGIAVHHERHESPAYAFALASLQRPHFPLPIGVFRAVEKPSYDRLLDDQVEAAIAKKGKGDLEKLLNSGDTWTVSD